MASQRLPRRNASLTAANLTAWKSERTRLIKKLSASDIPPTREQLDRVAFLNRALGGADAVAAL